MHYPIFYNTIYHNISILLLIYFTYQTDNLHYSTIIMISWCYLLWNLPNYRYHWWKNFRVYNGISIFWNGTNNGTQRM